MTGFEIHFGSKTKHEFSNRRFQFIWLLKRRKCLDAAWIFSFCGEQRWEKQKKKSFLFCSPACLRLPLTDGADDVGAELMSERAKEKEERREERNLTAVWRLTGEREMSLWLQPCHQDLSHSLSHTRTHIRGVGYFGVQRWNERPSQML